MILRILVFQEDLLGLGPQDRSNRGRHMAISEFEEVCTGFCELAGTPLPDLAQDGRGIHAFSVPVQGVDITVAYAPARHPGLVYSVLPLRGVGMHGSADEHRGVLRANARGRNSWAPVFCRDAGTGRLALRQTHRLQDLTPMALHLRLAEAARVASDPFQTDTRFCDGLDAEPAHMEAAKAFDALVKGLCRQAGRPDAGGPVREGSLLVKSFTVDERTVNLVYGARGETEFAVDVQFDHPGVPVPEHALASLLECNLLTMTDPHAPCFALGDADRLLLRSWHVLDATEPSRLLVRIEFLVAMAWEWWLRCVTAPDSGQDLDRARLGTVPVRA